MFDYLLMAVIPVAVIILFFLSVRRVEQGTKLVVLRFGKAQRTLEPGLHFIVPFYEETRWVDMKVQQVDAHSSPGNETAVTADNVPIRNLSVRIFLQGRDPIAMLFATDDGVESLRALVESTLRALIARMRLDVHHQEHAEGKPPEAAPQPGPMPKPYAVPSPGDAPGRAAPKELVIDASLGLMQSQHHICMAITDYLDAVANMWGYDLLRIEVLTVDLPAEVLKGMEQLVLADREARAAQRRAEGQAASIAALNEALRAHPEAAEYQLAMQRLAALQEGMKAGKHTLVVPPNMDDAFATNTFSAVVAAEGAKGD